MAHKSRGHFFISAVRATSAPAAICFQEGDHLFFKEALGKEL